MSNWLADRIASQGPMPVDAFMRACLTDPEHGYYRRSQAIGAAGDFITAPEISQVFGELIGIWVAASWQALGAPARWRLIELGPGRGTLMADLLRALKVLPAARAAVQVVLVEVNERLRAEQRGRLAGYGIEVTWREDLVSAVEPLPTVVIANEFLDALPIRQLVAKDGQWRERLVGLTALEHAAAPHPNSFPVSTGSGGAPPMERDPSPRFYRERAGVRGGYTTGVGQSDATQAVLAFSVSAEPANDAPLDLPPKPEGAICELQCGAAEVIRHLSRALAAAPQTHLYIDYGHSGPVIGDTLQAVAAHRYADPLEAPGEHDLSAQVDFAQIAGAAKANGLTAHGPIAQAALLGRLGAANRLERLAAGKDARAIHQLQTGLTRLMDPSGMGGRFKAMALASPGLAVPPVF